MLALARKAGMSGLLWAGLVAVDFGVDFVGPGFNAAMDGLGMFETLVAEPDGDVHGSNAMMAKDEEALFGIKFLMSAGRHLAHGYG